MTINQWIACAAIASALLSAGSARAQNCTRQGNDVTCDDGRRGILDGDAILWPDGTRSSSVPHPSVIIGNKSSVVVGQGVFVGKGDPKRHAMKRHLWTVSESLVPSRRVFDFNQALMDLGAMVCVARNPNCPICPMSRDCRAFPFIPGPGT